MQVENEVSKRKTHANAIIDTGSNRTVGMARPSFVLRAPSGQGRMYAVRYADGTVRTVSR